MNEPPRRDPLKGIIAGLIGGLVASWTMNRFQDAWSRVSEADQSAGVTRGEGSNSDVSRQAPQPSSEADDDTTARAASAVSEGLFDHKLTKEEKKIAGPAVHYSLGTGVGGLYGLAAELAPDVTAEMGLPFGAAFWLVVDEGAVPLLGLAKGPTAYPLSTHVYALTSHLIYGLTTEVVRRAVRRVL